MKIRDSSYFLMVIMVVMLVVIILSLRMEYFESKLLPLVICGVVFVLASTILWEEMRASYRSSATATGRETAGQEGTRVSWRQYWIAGAWIVGYFLAIYLLGFIIATPLFMLVYMKSHGTRWFVASIFTVLAPLSIYSIFELALNVHLYRGLILGD